MMILKWFSLLDGKGNYGYNTSRPPPRTVTWFLWLEFLRLNVNVFAYPCISEVV